MGLTGFQRRRRELAAERSAAAAADKPARKPRAQRAVPAAEEPQAEPTHLTADADQDSPASEGGGSDAA